MQTFVKHSCTTRFDYIGKDVLIDFGVPGIPLMALPRIKIRLPLAALSEFLGVLNALRRTTTGTNAAAAHMVHHDFEHGSKVYSLRRNLAERTWSLNLGMNIREGCPPECLLFMQFNDNTVDDILAGGLLEQALPVTN